MKEFGRKYTSLRSNSLHWSGTLGEARFKFWVISNLPLPVQSCSICILNYHDSGYTNSSLHLQSSCAHELAWSRSRVQSRSVRNCDNWLLKQCSFICATDI